MSGWYGVSHEWLNCPSSMLNCGVDRWDPLWQPWSARPHFLPGRFARPYHRHRATIPLLMAVQLAIIRLQILGQTMQPHLSESNRHDRVDPPLLCFWQNWSSNLRCRFRHGRRYWSLLQVHCPAELVLQNVDSYWMSKYGFQGVDLDGISGYIWKRRQVSGHCKFRATRQRDECIIWWTVWD